MSDNIKVVIKVRPLIPREIEDKLFYQWRVNQNTIYQIDQNGRDIGPSFTYDKVYDKAVQTSEVYNDIAKPIVKAALAGFNGTIFAYGQTSSGKTYTMTGTDESPGIIPLAVSNLFEMIKDIPDRDFLVRVSYVEIYNESLTDLLDSEKKVKIQDTLQGLKVDTTEKLTTSPEEVLNVMKEGKANRQTASTNMNDESSRSHSIFQITIESRKHSDGEESVGTVNVSQLNLVDLAGSERAGQTGATGLRFIEGTHINRSLSNLALVIKQLSEGQNKHVNYRDSKLTRILQNSLGGNAKTSIICAVTPAAVEETISTLQFANRAKSIKNRPEINAVLTSASMIQNLTKQLSTLMTALENKKNVEQDNCNLQRQIANLQRFILNGFHQRSSTDMILGARRKLYQPRRMTISTLHSIQEDSPPKSIPKFCTPSLKYNPLSVPGSSDFVPISAGPLPSLAEVPPRVTTPPPKNKVHFNESVIEIDSDDDDPQTCSPYHVSCRESKTPPCILRRNCKEAEKNLKDLVQLTEREKIYSPDVVELMNKLDEKSSALLAIEDNYRALNDSCKEKDELIENLQQKITQVEGEVKSLSTAKTELNALCKEYQSKLTDLEVSFDTLMKRSKNRENELLSLLEEQSAEKNLTRNGTFNSPPLRINENNQPVETVSTEIMAVTEDLKTQILLKEQSIIELEAYIQADKLKIETLDKVNNELNEILSEYKQNVLFVENENALFKSNMKDLKNLLEDHKAEIITLNADIDSYKSMIQELQDKLTNPVVVIGDNDIDRLIASEQLFIANNENIKNVILSLKTALEKKNEELCTLKNTSNTDSSETLTTIQELQEQLAANAQVIHTLTLEKSQLKSTEQQLSEKLLDLENVKFNVDKINNDSTIQIQLLKEENNNLRADIITLKGKYESEITHMTEKIRNLESDICSKHDVILTYDDKVSLLEVINKHEIEIMQLKETLNDCNKIVDSFTEDLIEYNNSNIHKEIGENLEPNSDLRNKIRNFIDIVKQIQKTLLQSIDCKNVEIDEIKQDLIGKGIELEEKSSLLENNYQVLHIIENKIRNVLSKLNIESQRFEGKDQMEHILLMVESLVDYHKTITSENEDKSTHIETIISEAKAEISALTQENIKLNNDILQFEVDKAGLYKEINTAKDDKVQIIQDLKTSNRILGELQDDLKSKTSEIEILEKKALQWKEQFLNSDTKVKLQLNELESDNNKLREQLERYSAHSLTVSSDNYNQYDINSKGNSEEIPELQSPPSLLTICCNRICEAIQPVESDDLNSVPSDAGVQCNCRCTELSSEIDILLGNKNYLENVVEKVQNDNMNLLKEQEDARREIQLLVDSMFELQKKIVNHRTNLSTLTATTYAENKSLTSQLKFLQHYHSLFYRSCEKDIPEFKKQLQDLLTILKTEYSNKHNDSFRRYSLPSALDNSVLQSLKYESLLDGDLLMLDTNITLTTCDNTVVGNDQTLDLTQISKEVSCQTTSTSDVFETDSALFEMKTASKILQNIESIKMENDKLKEVVEEYELMKVNKSKLVDSANSPLKTPLANIQGDKTCDNCKRLQEILDARNNIIHENELLKQKLSETITIKTDLESQYNNLVLEIPSIDALVDKLKNTEKETVIKSSEILKLTKSLDEKNLELKNLQEENNTLSNQLMENIDEADSLKNEVELLKKRNTEITQKYSELHKSTDLPEKENSNDSENYIKECSECLMKDSIITSLKSKLISEPNQILSRSYSESESSSRYNKICTLQNEIHAGKEDCNELKNEVINIKNHLDRSNVDQAMDLDVSMGDSFKMSFNKECEDVEESVNKSIIHGIPEERPSDIYTLDKIDCVNYCIDKTGLNKEKFTCDMKIIDVMQMLHTNFITKHSNEVENLVNQLKDLQESRNSLQFRVNNLIDSQEKLSKEVEEKNTYLQTMAIVVSNIKNNLLALNTVSDDCDELVFIEYYKDNFCKIVDKELGLESLKVFENIVNIIEEKHKSEIIRLSQNDKLQQSQIQHVTEELQSLSKQLEALKSEIKNKENDYNLLRLQKQRIHEISNAVTLDIIKKEKGLRETISKVYEKLAQQNLIDTQVVNASAPVNDVISDLLNSLLQKQTNSNVQKENSNLLLELTDIKLLLEERNKQICELKDKLSDVNRKHREEVDKKEKELQEQVALHNILRSTYDKKVEENEANINVIAKLTDEINILKGTIIGKELAILALEDKLHNQKQQSPSKNTQLLEALQQYKEEIEKLKSANDIIQKEKELACEQLQQANDLIQQNKVEIERITSDVLILKETVDHNSNDMEDLRLEARRLLEQNTQLKEQMKEKTKELSRLETNIKTYQKSAEISCKMITRLKKEKADVEKSNSELVEKVAELTRVVEELNAEDKLYLDEVNTLKTEKQSLEERIAELETDLNKQRLSLDINAGLRSRRQSLYDSLRTFSESEEDPKKIEAEFKARRCDDNFMDVDDNSNRSTPIKLPKGRDSLASRHDQSEEEGSRASSVQAIRRRRQSIHDAHRSVSALETSRRHSADRNNESSSSDTTGEVSKLRKQLLQCKEELEEWRDKYREVDEECEICAQYLRERDEQCRNLRSDKQNLEALIDELKQQLQVVKHVKNESVEAGVNTDEDWANLHSIVVDRMSYDAEVDKNKKLTKIVEELRFQKQELKVTMTKMQKVLDSNSFRDRELETVKSELANCRKQVAELKERNRELDEECETCAEYLKEREEQCRKLKEAKKSLEIKLLDYQDSSVCLSVRKKRQSLHDQNRVPRTDVVHVATDTGDDLSNTALEEGECCKRTAEIHAEELRRLRLAVERSSQQKAALEQQLVAISAATPLYVSTGSAIVQNQQITDVLRENQKLKSINSKLMKIYKKSKSLSTNRENEDPADDTNT